MINPKAFDRAREERAATAARLFDEVRGRPMIDPLAPPEPVPEPPKPKPVSMRDGEQSE
jgi:hypothetical protein